jgi:hypothetical protein
MAKVKIVRCRVSRPSGEPGESIRYVPLDVFDLWRFLMKEKHGFRVETDCVSLWFDIDGDPHVTYSDRNYDKVVRIKLRVYSTEEEMFREVVRYFPAEDYERIKPHFLSHYGSYFASSGFAPAIEETSGVWLKTEESLV